MFLRALLAVSCASFVTIFSWFTSTYLNADSLNCWEKVSEGIYRTKSTPHGYALIDRDKALLIDASVAWEIVEELGVKKIDIVLLTHHHRDAVPFAAEYRKKGVSVRAPKESAEWLSPEQVEKFWKDSIPLRNSRTAYFVVPVGLEGIDYTIVDGAKFNFGKWQITAIATPGHSRDHFAYLCTVTERKNEPSHLFCGDAFSRPGLLWTPFTTDWDHWTDVGLKPTANSASGKWLKLNPTILCPAHGSIIDNDGLQCFDGYREGCRRTPPS